MPLKQRTPDGPGSGTPIMPPSIRNSFAISATLPSSAADFADALAHRRSRPFRAREIRADQNRVDDPAGPDQHGREIGMVTRVVAVGTLRVHLATVHDGSVAGDIVGPRRPDEPRRERMAEVPGEGAGDHVLLVGREVAGI